jgi:hypothetical protein
MPATVDYIPPAGTNNLTTESIGEEYDIFYELQEKQTAKENFVV